MTSFDYRSITGKATPLLPEQIECIEKGFANQNFLDNSPLGHGKSVTAFAVAMRIAKENPGSKVMVVGSKNVLNSLKTIWDALFQFREARYIDFVGVNRENVLKNEMKNSLKQVIFVPLSILVRENKKATSVLFDPSNSVSGFILDEVHKLTRGSKGADGVMKLLNTFPGARVWAATATEDKKMLQKSLSLITRKKKVSSDELDELKYRSAVREHGSTTINQVFYDLSDTEMARYVAELDHSGDDALATLKKTQLTFVHRLLLKDIKEMLGTGKSMLTRMPDKSTGWISSLFMVIINMIQENIKKDELTIIFFNNVWLLKLLTAVLRKFFNPDPELTIVRIEALTGDLLDKDRITLMKEIANPPPSNAVNVLLATYAVCSTSVNLHGPDPRTLILAQLPVARETYSQAIGRVSGRMGSGEVSVVVPLVKKTTGELLHNYLCSLSPRTRNEFKTLLLKAKAQMPKTSRWDKVPCESEEDEGDHEVAEEDRLDTDVSDEEEVEQEVLVTHKASEHKRPPSEQKRAAEPASDDIDEWRDWALKHNAKKTNGDYHDEASIKRVNNVAALKKAVER